MDARNYNALGLDGDFSNKIRILTMSDDPRSNTGFGKVHKNIIDAIKSNPRYYVTSIGWFTPTHTSTKSETYKSDGLPITSDPDYNIIATKSHEEYATVTFKKVIDFFKPHIVITVGDPWMIDGIIKFKDESQFIWIGYIPIDGLDIPEKFKKTIDKMDYVVTYGRFGSQVLAATDFDMTKVTEICHGVEEEIYKPIDKIEARKTLGIPTNPFIVLWVGRNIYRKRVDIILESFSKFIAPSISCSICGSIYFKGHGNYEYIDKTKHCLGCNKNLQENDLIRFVGREDCMLFLHTTSFDIGFDINEYIRKYGLNGKIIAPTNMQIGMGIPEEKMQLIYNAADVFVNTSTAEGWGMPIHEAMACGLPVVVPDFGGYIGSLVQNNKTGFCYAIQNLDRTDMGYIRCIPHSTDLAKYLDLIYNVKFKTRMSKRWFDKQKDMPEELFKQVCQSGKERAIELNWTNFKEKWAHVVESSIPEVQNNKIIDEIIQRKTDKKRIIIFSDYLLPLHGGAENSIFEIAKQLNKEGCDVICYYCRSRGLMFNKYKTILNSGITIIQGILNKDLIDKFIQEVKPDLVLVQLRLVSLIGKICIDCNIPYHVFIRSYEGICESPLRMSTCKFNCSSCSTYYEGRTLRDGITLSLNGAEYVICNSEYTKEVLELTKSASKDTLANRTKIIYPFIDPENENFIVSEFAPRSLKFITLIKGTEAKGSLMFIDIINRLMRDYKDVFNNHKFLIVGNTDNITVDAINRMAINNLDVSGTVDDMSQIYAQSAVVLIPCIWKEPFCRVAIEAGLNRIPILASDNAGLRESVSDICRIKNYFDSDSWVRSLVACIEDKDHREVMIRHQYEHARQVCNKSNTQTMEYISLCL
jgi:glycosyltransferase involved in cell wall biosynthesis